MENYIAVNFKHIDLENGSKLNNLLYSQQIEYNINKELNSYKIDWIVNNENINLTQIYKNISETFCIITEDDYKSLVGLLYSDNKTLINYNDKFYILEINYCCTFLSNDNLNNKIKKNFSLKKNL